MTSILAHFENFFVDISVFRKIYRKKNFEIIELGFEKFRNKNFEIKKKYFDIDISKFQNFERIKGTNFRNYF